MQSDVVRTGSPASTDDQEGREAFLFTGWSMEPLPLPMQPAVNYRPVTLTDAARALFKR